MNKNSRSDSVKVINLNW